MTYTPINLNFNENYFRNINKFIVYWHLSESNKIVNGKRVLNSPQVLNYNLKQIII